MGRRFYHLDVFASRPLAGNPLAVFPQAEGISEQMMRALARELNLSETVFVLPSAAATRRLRIFTPAAEVPLAGHPTIGTWWLLAELGQTGAPENGSHVVTQETGAGVLPVEITFESGKPTRVVMTQTTPSFHGTLNDVDELARRIGARPNDIASSPAPEVVSTAFPQLMVPLTSLAALEALPSGGAGSDLANYLREHGTDCVMCYVLDDAEGSTVARCRFFAPALGVPEDPATGSASGALGAYLGQHGILGTESGEFRFMVRQGLEIGRPSEIEVFVRRNDSGEITEVRVGGQAVTVITGEVLL